MIDYKLLAKATKYFGKKGFKQVETPWRVSKEAIDCTFDPNLSIKSEDKFLVGSAEQGLVQVILDDTKERNVNYQVMSVSPCFRNEKEDYYHQSEFMKLELMYLSYHEIIKDDIQFKAFRQWVIDFITSELKVKTSDIVIKETVDEISSYSEDILINGIEYGSYGIRTVRDKWYIYGTGIALPRASKILNSISTRISKDSTHATNTLNMYKKIKKVLKRLKERGI